ncbi:uncharacterized protein LOC106377948 isoform X7 [Brassica napus]|nr:uncharacterized protein LOC106377948 isoform X5 [Brassica napus]XP_048603747.1 uncharacterized protein LOC106377948 isoform X6 [Brassica napus]XP_048603748.1 uncharacterized protein LOC106377948 isoform X7 [Brassica napus]
MSGTPTQSRRPLSRGTSSSSAPFVSRESPSAPSQDGQPLPTNMDIDELIRQPGRETLPRLNPNYKTIPNTTVFGLSESGVSKSLLRIVYSGLLPKGWPTYAEIPPRYRNLWFRQFAQEYNWDSGLTGRVKISFDQYATRYYSGRISEWKKVWEAGKTPKNVSLTVLEELIVHWGKPETKAQSETNSKNKRSDRGGKGAYVHNLGSTSLLSRERQLKQRPSQKPTRRTSVVTVAGKELMSTTLAQLVYFLENVN